MKMKLMLDDNFHLQVDEPLTESQAVVLEGDEGNIGAATVTCSMNETESLVDIDLHNTFPTDRGHFSRDIKSDKRKRMILDHVPSRPNDDKDLRKKEFQHQT